MGPRKGRVGRKRKAPSGLQQGGLPGEQWRGGGRTGPMITYADYEIRKTGNHITQKEGRVVGCCFQFETSLHAVQCYKSGS